MAGARSLTIEDPSPAQIVDALDALEALGSEGVAVRKHDRRALVATIDGPVGRVELR